MEGRSGTEPRGWGSMKPWVYPKSFSGPWLTISNIHSLLDCYYSILPLLRLAALVFPSSIMAIESESQIKHHPDHWSLTSNNHHHVERTVHPVIVELVRWVCASDIPVLLLTFGRQATRNPLYITPLLAGLELFLQNRKLTAKIRLRQRRPCPQNPLLRSLMTAVASAL
jgi:hypothetical protein